MSCLARQYRPIEYVNHLYESELDGYVQVMQLYSDKYCDIKNFKKMTINDVIRKYKGFEDVFITPNTTFNGRRRVENIRQLRALFTDIDNKKLSFDDIIQEVWNLVELCKIPKPTMVISSGRGCHLYWRIKHAPYQALAIWQELQDYLSKQLKDVGADRIAIDATRELRLPGTINSKNGAECKIVLMDEDTTYSMYDLIENYLKWKPKTSRTVETTEIVNNKQVKNTIVQFFTSYSLHIARAKDILTLCKLRKYNLIGYRNFILHCYAYWIGVTTRDKDTLEEVVNELNNKFKTPLKNSEVKAIVRCVPRAIDKFVDYEQGLRSGEVKRVSKGMRDKGGYWYKNETLIDRLNITLEEQKHLKTIISNQEKYRRCADDKKAKQKAKRRNEDGLTKRQQEKQEKIKEVKALLEKGLGVKAIARELKVNVSLVSRIKNNKY